MRGVPDVTSYLAGYAAAGGDVNDVLPGYGETKET